MQTTTPDATTDPHTACSSCGDTSNTPDCPPSSATRVAANAALDSTLDELARVVTTPGAAAQLALWAVARDVLHAAGREVPDELDDPRGRPWDASPRRGARPTPWAGERLARPSARSLDRVYQRGWDPDWGWHVDVRTIRGGRPVDPARPLWLRRHRASEHPDWRGLYDWSDRWDVPDSAAIRRLGTDLCADALDRPRTAFSYRHQAGRLVSHFVGDVLWPLGDGAWHLRRSEIINWMDLHAYLEPSP